MSEQWYWRSNARIRGPLTTSELEEIVLKNRLGDADAVRLDRTDEWIPAPDIRGMFLPSSANSPAETAARLLETAASRRLQGTTGRSRTFLPGGAFFGGIAGRLTGVLGEIAGGLLDILTRGFRACTDWLGRRGRMIVTAIAGIAVLGFITIRVFSLEPPNTSRLQRIDAIWRVMKASDVRPLPADVTAQLEAVYADLERSLREQPVSGTTGAARKSALVRREMFYAARGMRNSLTSIDEPTRKQIEQSIETAKDYLSGSAAPLADTAVPQNPAARWSAEMVAILVIDVVLAVAFAAWWVIGRDSG